MRSSKILNLWNSYLDPLETINGVKFTPKEIELMACMLSGKSAKTISSFLSVSPKTIEGHLRNITKKLACNSRDGIIHFIENSDKLASLKEYYLNLLIQNTFKKALQEIDKLIRPRASKCRIIYWPELDDKNHDAEQLAHYLEIAGIKSFIEARKGYQFLSPNFNIQEFQKNHILYLTPEAIVNQLSGDSGSDQSTALTVVKACSQNGSKSIFFCLWREN